MTIESSGGRDRAAARIGSSNGLDHRPSPRRSPACRPSAARARRAGRTCPAASTMPTEVRWKRSIGAGSAWPSTPHRRARRLAVDVVVLVVGRFGVVLVVVEHDFTVPAPEGYRGADGERTFGPRAALAANSARRASAPTPAFDDTFATAQRIALDEYRVGRTHRRLGAGRRSLFETVVAHAPWEHRTVRMYDRMV